MNGRFLTKIGGPVIFLTGATGFLGGAFLSHILDSSFEGSVVCLVRADDQDSAEERVRRSITRFGRPSHLPRNVSVLRGDLLSHEWHDAPVLANVTHVLHLAASTSFGSNRGIQKTNVDGALSVAGAMRGRQLERYIHVGTATICGDTTEKTVYEDDYPSDKAHHLLTYTKSKAEAERQLAARYSDLPLVVARPSVVVGHTNLGCKPSGSIFWVLRAFEALRFITWDPHNRIDVVPVDWTAAALGHLLFAPTLQHNRYHVSAGAGRSVRWNQLAAEYARLHGGAARDRYEIGSIEQLTLQRIRNADLAAQSRHLRQALELYSRFCSLDLVFDNHRLLAEGFPAPPRFTDYMERCLESSPASIYEQMRVDLDPSLALV
ncbi:MAG: SDR family oxidoreductase [Acidobacteriota bacterium]